MMMMMVVVVLSDGSDIIRREAGEMMSGFGRTVMGE